MDLGSKERDHHHQVVEGVFGTLFRGVRFTWDLVRRDDVSDVCWEEGTVGLERRGRLPGDLELVVAFVRLSFRLKKEKRNGEGEWDVLGTAVCKIDGVAAGDTSSC